MSRQEISAPDYQKSVPTTTMLTHYRYDVLIQREMIIYASHSK
jgi:hypothetical protein